MLADAASVVTVPSPKLIVTVEPAIEPVSVIKTEPRLAS